MKNFWVLVFALIPFNSLASQEVQHAPTVEQCRADQRLWFHKLEEPNSAAVASVGFDELNGWVVAMYDCSAVDPEWSNSYLNVIADDDATQVMKLLGFLRRHNLYSQFIVEDAQGKR